jgi:FtsZ-interacting cell division protein ZipA
VLFIKKLALIIDLMDLGQLHGLALGPKNVFSRHVSLKGFAPPCLLSSALPIKKTASMQKLL